MYDLGFYDNIIKGDGILYYIYMLRCVDDTIYTGITSDVERRMDEHFSKSKKCAKYTRSHTPLKIEAVWESENKSFAATFEFYVKRLTKTKKEELISDNKLSLLENKINIDVYKRIEKYNGYCK